MKILWIVLLALMLTACRTAPVRKPDYIVDIPLHPTEAVTRPVAVETAPPETEPPTHPPETVPATEAGTEPANTGPVMPHTDDPLPTRPPVTVDPALAGNVAAAVNERRQKAGLAPLVTDAGLCAKAEIRAGELLVLLAHTRPDGTGWESVLGGRPSFAAELIRYGSGGASSIVDSWMNAAGSREKLLSESAAAMGVGTCAADGVTYVVLIITG